MAKKLQLIVPEPCQQEWDGMTPTNGGRFCGSCQKVVVDFSTMTDQQLINYFQNATGSVCGRFEKTQLEREILIPKRGLPWVRYFFQFTLPAFLLSLKASGQSNKVIGRRAYVSTIFPTTPVKDIAKAKGEPQKTINGKITNEKGEPIPFATVNIKATNAGVSADASGNFSLKYQYDSSITLVISSVGYTTTLYEVNDTNNIKVIMPIELDRMLGEVVVTGYAIKRPKKSIPLFSTIKLDTAFSGFSVYPNPVPSNGNITIESKKLDKGEYDVQLTSLDGKQVCVKSLVLESKGGLLRMDLPTLAPGQYVITLINKHEKKAYTEKITVL